MTHKVPWWRRLHMRLAASMLLVLLALGGSLAFWLDMNLRRQQDALWQWQGLALAQYINRQQPEPLIDEQGKVRSELVRSLAMYARLINPALEVYLLDPQGVILDHTQDGPNDPRPQLQRVDLDPVHALARTPLPTLPVYGVDPLVPDTPNLISAARLEVEGQMRGYVYVVLRGTRASLLTMDAVADPLRAAAWRFVPAVLLAAAVLMLLAQLRITRPLSRLTTLLSEFRADGQEAGLSTHTPRHEIEEATLAAQALRARVQRQLNLIEDNERQRRELIASISHDLHTPLASIQGYAETLMLQQATLTPEQRSQHLHTLMQNCHRLERRVNDLFELSKLESGYTEAQPEPFSVAELASDVVQSLQLLAQTRGVTLEMAPPPADERGRELQVHADIGMIERVLQNLIDNAIGHTPPGGRVALSIADASDLVTVEVADSGEGIAADDLPFIFNLFWTRGMPTAVPQRGQGQERRGRARTGLGLAIVQRILALHGSQPQVYSHQGAGTRISFALKKA